MIQPRLSGDSDTPRGSESRASECRTPRTPHLLAFVEPGAAKPTVGAGADKSKPNAEYRGRRIKEGEIWVSSRKAFDKRWLVLWENKELIVYPSKPYNDRSVFKALVKLTPAGSFFFLQSAERSHCFEVHQGQTLRFSCATSEEREKWTSVLLRSGLRLLAGPGQGEPESVKNLVEAMRVENKAPDSVSVPVLCSECDTQAAEVVCQQCEDPYCQKCFELQHKGGKRASHTTQPVARPSKSGIDIVELYSQPFPVIFAEILEPIPTFAEVDAYVPPKSPSLSPSPASEKEWSRQSDLVDSISHEELLRKQVIRSTGRQGLGSKGGLLKNLDDSDDEEGDDPEALRVAVEAQTQLINQFRSCCEIKDRSYLLRSYPKCFVGKDTVDQLVKKEVVFTRSEAVRIGNKLLEAGVFAHVTGEHAFEDANLYYRFNADMVQLVRA